LLVFPRTHWVGCSGSWSPSDVSTERSNRRTSCRWAPPGVQLVQFGCWRTLFRKLGCRRAVFVRQ
jgi:hypothetical protein